ncbi:NAD(P)H-hydrate dehydratase [Actinospongicola halichondriae]|uniref:NAD(P)H-hydrate dehydratase n=1 Tax=Actinospongicola halichondriae TaxID=3236844 RepID=UPI003D41D398
MKPVVRVAEMAAIDAEADDSVDVLIDRAGRATAHAARSMMGGSYGRRVVVLHGTGNNGADGRVAGRVLARRGVRVTEIDLATAPAVLPDCDLVIDAAVGTGCTRDFFAPDPGDAAVLAVDIPSGVHGDTGRAMGQPMRADETITFGAYKPGLVMGDGPRYAGIVRVADIGLDVQRSTIDLVDDAGSRALLPARDVSAHKWRQAVLVVAGSPGMTGAASMAAAAAQRAGAGMVRVAAPGVDESVGPVEAVSTAVDERAWAETLLDDHERFHAVAIGPGLGHSMVTRHQVRLFVGRTRKPVVIDGDGLTALGTDVADVLAGRAAPTVLTPHDGEFERLTGARPGDDRMSPAQELAVRAGVTVLLKGPTTVIAAPNGALRLVDRGDARLATAGTGDVLTGVVAAMLAAGLDGFDAAAVGAHVHATAGTFAPVVGAIASDVIDHLPEALAAIGGRS